MLLRHTLLYLPAQIVGPLFQLIAMIVWTHVVDEHTLGVITLITATHELLQIAFLAWWSQYSLRFFGRYQDGNEASRFYRTENSVLLISIVLQSIAMIGILLLIIAPGAKADLIVIDGDPLADLTIFSRPQELLKLVMVDGATTIDRLSRQERRTAA